MDFIVGQEVVYEGIPNRRLVVSSFEGENDVVCKWSEKGIVWFGIFDKMTLTIYEKPEIIFF
ncbi:hypothetical protein HZP32_05725 [Elizabethkingia anophelis]|nr:hypothetical protein [Elizabethkingia anophelis]